MGIKIPKLINITFPVNAMTATMTATKGTAIANVPRIFLVLLAKTKASRKTGPDSGTPFFSLGHLTLPSTEDIRDTDGCFRLDMSVIIKAINPSRKKEAL
jgi:hypothetical protein